MNARFVRLVFVCLSVVSALVSDVRAQSSSGYLSGRMVMTPWNYPQPDFQPINLTAPEVLDWAYWGLSSNSSVDRKAGAGIIGSMSVVGSGVPTQDSSCFDQFTWSNGDVNASVPTACAGLMVFNSGEGFQFTLPADRVPKTLKLYTGIEGATGKLEAHLSDASASAYVDTSLITDGAAAATYIIDFQAGSPGQTLTVTYTLQDLEWGEVTLEAAVLTAKNPNVSLTQPAPGQAFTAPASFTASADASQPGGTLDSVSLFENGSTLLTLTGEPYDFQVSGLAAGNYELSAQALDSNGLSQTSNPVPIHVVGTGGELTASVAASPAAVDLTQQGTADWVLFGRDFNIDSDRKANVAPLIDSTSEPSVGGVSLLNWAYDYYYDDGAITYSGQDGAYQFGSATSGIYLPNPGSGFELSVDAGLTERTVKVYVGANRAQGKLEAYLSDGSAPVYVDSSTDSQDGINQAYSITFHAASDGQKLIIRYTLEDNYAYGNVTLQAITLSGSPVLTPVIDSIFPPGGGVGIPINISGANFGSNQNSATVTIDGVAANVVAWSNTSIRIAVPHISSSGSVIVTVNGFPSNPFPFQFVLAARSSSQSVNISPDEMYLEVAQERVLKLVDQRGAKVSDVTWSVDNEDIARVVPASDPNSTDQFLEGVGEGKVTITAVSSEGTAQAQASVFMAGQTPVGSPKWAVYPDNYNNDLGLPIKGMQNSPSDPYTYLIEYYGDGSAFAIRALDQTGQQIWRKNVPGMPDVNGNPSAYPANSIGTPDGGLLVNASYPNQSTLMMVAPDGTTKWTVDGSNMSNFAVGYDGTIYASKGEPTVGQSIVVIDGATGNSNYAITPNGAVGEGLVSDEAADAFHPCRDHINDIPPSQGIGGTFLAGPVVAANGHAYVVQTSDLYSFSYTSCNYGGGTNDAGITYYYIDSADGTLSESAQLVLRELTPTGPGDTVSIASNSYNGQAHLGRIGTGGGGGGGFSTPDGVAISNSWNVLGLAPDAEGGILVNTDDGKGSRLIRASQNVFQYLVPASGYDLAITENGMALIQEGFDSGVAAVNVDNGTSLWSTSNGRIVGATDDDGVLMQQYNNDGTSNIFELDKNGSTASPSIPLPGNHLEYVDRGEIAVQSMYYGAVLDFQTDQLTSGPGVRFPVPGAGNASSTKALLPGVITKEITVIGWIDKDLIPMPPTTNVNPALLSGLNDSCLSTVRGFSNGDRHLILDDGIDRPFANAFLLRNSSNGEPPLTLNPSVLSKRDFRLFNQVKAAISTSNDQITHVTKWITSQAVAGDTVDSCRSTLISLLSTFGLLSAEKHPDNGHRGITPDGLHLYQLNEARVGPKMQNANMTLNACTSTDSEGLCNANSSLATPWVWNYPLVDSNGSVLQPGASTPTNVKTQMFPTQYIYIDGTLVERRFQGNLESFIGLNSSNTELKESDIK